MANSERIGSVHREQTHSEKKKDEQKEVKGPFLAASRDSECDVTANPIRKTQLNLLLWASVTQIGLGSSVEGIGL